MNPRRVVQSSPRFLALQQTTIKKAPIKGLCAKYLKHQISKL